MGWLTVDIAINRKHLLKRDIQLARQIVQDIDKLTAHSSNAVIGQLPEDVPYMEDIRTYFGVNVWKFRATWSVISLLSSVSGRVFMPAHAKENIDALQLCQAKLPNVTPYNLLSQEQNILLRLPDIRICYSHV